MRKNHRIRREIQKKNQKRREQHTLEDSESQESPVDTFQQMLTKHWVANGFSRESTNLFVAHFERAMLEQGIKVNVVFMVDDNDYEEGIGP